MDPTFLQWLVGQSGIAGLAGISLYLLNRAQTDALRREQEYAANNRADKLELLHTLSESAKALSQLESAVETLANEYRHGTPATRRSGAAD